MNLASRTPGGVLDRLRADGPLTAVELRPPPAGLSGADAMDTWIDMAHAVRRMMRWDTVLFLTDNAVGAAEEENLHHLAANLADEVSPGRVVPFLTSKHSLDYCLLYAARAPARGYQALTVLGGDRRVGAPRCLPHAFELRKLLRTRMAGLGLGGWANPHRDVAQQVDLLLSSDFTAEFYLTQIVSHHDLPAVEAFHLQRAGLDRCRGPIVREHGQTYCRAAGRAMMMHAEETLRPVSACRAVPPPDR